MCRVEEYVNNTGLMWNLAKKMGCLVVFAEHRYEGQSFPKMHGEADCVAGEAQQQSLVASRESLVGLAGVPAWLAPDRPAAPLNHPWFQ